MRKLYKSSRQCVDTPKLLLDKPIPPFLKLSDEPKNLEPPNGENTTGLGKTRLLRDSSNLLSAIVNGVPFYYSSLFLLSVFKKSMGFVAHSVFKDSNYKFESLKTEKSFFSKCNFVY